MIAPGYSGSRECVAAVREAATFAVPHPSLGEDVVTAIVLHEPGWGLDGILGNTFLNRYRVTLDADRRQLQLRLLDRTIELAISAENAVKAVLTGVLLTPASLPGLDADEQLALARRLLREGVLVPA